MWPVIYPKLPLNLLNQSFEWAIQLSNIIIQTITMGKDYGPWWPKGYEPNYTVKCYFFNL